MSSARAFISIYFPDGITSKRKRRDLTVAFNSNDKLYELCKNLSSSNIKELIQIHSYKELVEKATEEERSLSNYIKHRLKVKVQNDKTNTIG